MNTNCPRCPDSPFEFANKPDDGTCDQCGSLLPDEFMARLEAGDVTLDPTDKNYKVYVHNAGGKPFQQSHRPLPKPQQPGEIVRDPMDQSLWTWETQEVSQCKFYFQHLSEDQMKRFVELLNENKLRLNYPGYFYRRPFFVMSAATAEEPPA